MTLVSQVGSCVVAGLTLYCSSSLIDGGRNKSGSKPLSICPGAPLYCGCIRVRDPLYNNQHCEARGEGLVACYILFSSLSLIIYDRHVRRTRTCACA